MQGCEGTRVRDGARVELPYSIKSNPTSFCNCFLVLFQVRPKEMRSLHKFDDEGKLQIEEGDLITVIDGR